MTLRTLGRCARKHAQVVEYADNTLPTGVCVVETCKQPLVEWAVKNQPIEAKPR